MPMPTAVRETPKETTDCMKKAAVGLVLTCTFVMWSSCGRWRRRTIRGGPHSRLGTPLGAASVRVMDLDLLGNQELLGADGARHRLGDFWADKPVVLVFLRHFG